MNICVSWPRLHQTNVLFRTYFSAPAWVTHDTLTQHLDPRWQLKVCGSCSCHFLWPSLQRRTRRSKQEVILKSLYPSSFHPPALWFPSRPLECFLCLPRLISARSLSSSPLFSPLVHFPLIFPFICCSESFRFLFPLSPHLTSLLCASQLPFALTCPSPSSLCSRRAVWRIFKSSSSTSITLKWFYTLVLGCRYNLPPALLERDRLGHCSRSNPTRPKVPQWPNNYNRNRQKKAAGPAHSQLMRCRITFPLFLMILPCFVAGAYFAQISSKSLRSILS